MHASNVLFVELENLTYLNFRLYLVGQLRANSCLLNICLHLTKLSLLLPSPAPSSHTLTTSLLTTVAIFLISYVVLREMLFEQSSSSSQVSVLSIGDSLFSVIFFLSLSLSLSLSSS